MTTTLAAGLVQAAHWNPNFSEQLDEPARMSESHGSRMDKFYVNKLTDWQTDSNVISSGAYDNNNNSHIKRVRLVEVQFSRKAPTFGLVYLTTDNGPEQRRQSDRQLLCLAALQLRQDNTARFDTLKRIQLGTIGPGQDKIDFEAVDFDVNESPLVDGNEHQLNKSSCLLLGANGSLIAISLIDCAVKWQLPRTRLAAQTKGYPSSHFVQCQLQRPLEGGETLPGALLQVHLLAERHYSSFKLTSQSGTSEQPILVQEHQLARDEALKFVRLHLVESNPQVGLVELSDGSLRIVKHSKCLHSIRFDSDPLTSGQRILVLSSRQADQSTILLCLLRRQLVAHSLLIGDEEDDDHEDHEDNDKAATKSGRPEKALNKRLDRDPDQLLPREPSFELEKCWSLDLDDIHSIRSIDEQEEGSEAGCMCPIWAQDQPQHGQSWPKFLLLALRHHILIYSFEQQTALPFSVVYDRAFLRLDSAGSTKSDSQQQQQQQQQQSEYLDLGTRPKLLHNFKLIGAQPADSLFNTLFLVSKIQLDLVRHFNQLGLLVGLSNAGDLLAFKLTSSRIVKQKDNLYQQLLLNSIREGSLLRQVIDSKEANNSSLREDIAGLESRSRMEAGQKTTTASRDRQLLENLDRMFRVELEAHDFIGGLYELKISWPNLVQINRLLVVSTVDAHILNNSIDSSQQIKSFKTDNDCKGEQRRSIFHFGSNLNELDVDLDSIKAWTVLEFHERPENVSVRMSIFLIDGQFGQLKLHFIFGQPQRVPGLRARSSPVSEELDEMNFVGKGQRRVPQMVASKFCRKLVHIKPLMSFKQVVGQQAAAVESPEAQANKQRLEIRGPCDRQRMVQWLSECLTFQQVSAALPDDNFGVQFKSSFTHCSLDVRLGQGQLSVESDDFVALELIKRHILKSATDESIKLDVSHSTPSTNSLRHLIGKQRTNVDLAWRISRPLTSSAVQFSQPQNQVEMLLENLLSESNLSELSADWPVGQSTSWLERSLRLDIEKCLEAPDAQQVAPLAPDDEPPQTDLRPTTLRELICGFIVDALVDYDHLHALRSSTDMMLQMRLKLLNLVQSSEKSKLSKRFVDQIMSDWSEVRKKFNQERGASGSR